ncbi:MAG TPA: cation transporter [candidate division Zixibacteria bacterium]|nr:cation transporter [candidate division Zixibacteria bacterium]
MSTRSLAIVSVVAASSCCVVPLILLGLTLLGVGVAGLGAVSSVIGSLKWYLLTFATISLGLSYLSYFRNRRKCQSAGCSSPVSEKISRVVLIISTVSVAGFSVWSLAPLRADSESAAATVVRGGSRAVAIFDVEGMTCTGCEFAVREAVVALNGADSATVSYAENRAVIWYDDRKLDDETIRAGIGSVGYHATRHRRNKHER